MLKITEKTITDKAFDTINNFILLIITMLVLYPLIIIVSSSLSDAGAVMRGEILLFPKGINLLSYERVLRDENIITGYMNTFQYTIAGTAVNLLMTVAAAYPLSRKDFRGRNAFTAIFMFTMFFGGGLIPTYLLIKSMKMINTFWVMIIPNAVSMWNIIIMRTYFQNSIPQELQESASIDGCSNTRILLKIILPLSKPILAVMVLFYGVGHWNAFFNGLIYLNDKNKYPLQLVLRQILLQNEMASFMDGGSEGGAEQLLLYEGIKYAMIIIASIPVLILYPFLQKYFVKGVMIGAIKG